jgi:hypothetical protein
VTSHAHQVNTTSQMELAKLHAHLHTTLESKEDNINTVTSLVTPLTTSMKIAHVLQPAIHILFPTLNQPFTTTVTVHARTCHIMLTSTPLANQHVSSHTAKSAKAFTTSVIAHALTTLMPT